MDAKMIEKLKKVLALTNSPEEGEAQTAAAMLARLLSEHNLSVADLESKGQTAPGVKQDTVDLAKAAFKWKLVLADTIADFYFCHSLTNHGTKKVAFVGRPNNVESLKMLYAWLIDQIRDIASTQRRHHHIRTGEHIDPLRWQLNFGEGCVQRLGERLVEMRRAEQSKAGTALAIHHGGEISDFLEKEYGYRVDGKKTAEEIKEEERRAAVRARWAKEDAEAEALKAQCMLTGNMEPYYALRPYDRPETAEQMQERLDRRARERKAEEARERRNAKRRTGCSEKPRYKTAAEWRKEEEASAAYDAGRDAGDSVNLTPFIEDKQSPGNEERLGG